MNPSYMERALRLAHTIYDFNTDRMIDELDVYCFYYCFETDNPDLFMGLYFEDIMKVISRIQDKKRERGFLNREIDLKLHKIKLRLDKIKRGHNLGDLKRMDSEAAREELRRFVFEEFIKKDPDAISFERPDSGSRISEQEDGEDD